MGVKYPKKPAYKIYRVPKVPGISIVIEMSFRWLRLVEKDGVIVLETPLKISKECVDRSAKMAETRVARK